MFSSGHLITKNSKKMCIKDDFEHFLKHEKAYIVKNKGWRKSTGFTWAVRKGSAEYLVREENVFQDSIIINIFFILIHLQ